uniref:PDZ domain-containing protein n=1 Tax=Plectus sambesii TaxID=2011161 RepID=A0A914WF17_9BILA
MTRWTVDGLVVVLVLLWTTPTALAVDTCLQASGLAGLIFGCIFGTVLVCVVVALLLWWLLKRRKPGEKILVIEKPSEQTAYDNRALDVEDKGVATEETPARPRRVKKTRDQGTSNDTLQEKPKHRPSFIDRLRSKKSFSNSQSTDSLQAQNETVFLKSRDLGGLGFNIHGNMSDGIYIKDLLENGPAVDSGKIFPGDRLVNVTINFEKIVFEDALTILSYASPYMVTLELQRRVETVTIPVVQTEANSIARIHPLFRSQSISELPVSSQKSEARRALSLHTKTPVPVHVVESDASDNRSLTPIIENVAPMHRTTIEMEIGARTPTPSPPPTTSDDPYSSLSASEKFEVMQLSYEEPVTSASTPDLYHPDEVDSLEQDDEDNATLSSSPPPPPKPILSRASPTPAQSDNDSLPDVETIKQQFEMNRLELRTPSPSPPPLPPPLPPPPEIATLSVKKFGRPDEMATSPIIERKLPKLPSSAISPRRSKEDDAEAAMRLYQQRRQQLKPAGDRSSWARTAVSDSGSDHSGLTSALTSPTGSTGVRTVSSVHPPLGREFDTAHTNGDPALRRKPLVHDDSLDKDQVAKLMYNQQYLVKQQEDLARMGVHIPLSGHLKSARKGNAMLESGTLDWVTDGTLLTLIAATAAPPGTNRRTNGAMSVRRVRAPQCAVRLDADGRPVEEVTVDCAFHRPEQHEEVTIEAGLGIMSESMFSESMVGSVIENKPDAGQDPAAAQPPAPGATVPVLPQASQPAPQQPATANQPPAQAPSQPTPVQIIRKKPPPPPSSDEEEEDSEEEVVKPTARRSSGFKLMTGNAPAEPQTPAAAAPAAAPQPAPAQDAKAPEKPKSPIPQVVIQPPAAAAPTPAPAPAAAPAAEKKEAAAPPAAQAPAAQPKQEPAESKPKADTVVWKSEPAKDAPEQPKPAPVQQQPAQTPPQPAAEQPKPQAAQQQPQPAQQQPSQPKPAQQPQPAQQQAPQQAPQQPPAQQPQAQQKPALPAQPVQQQQPPQQKPAQPVQQPPAQQQQVQQKPAQPVQPLQPAQQPQPQQQPLQQKPAQQQQPPQQKPAQPFQQPSAQQPQAQQKPAQPVQQPQPVQQQKPAQPVQQQPQQKPVQQPQPVQAQPAAAAPPQQVQQPTPGKVQPAQQPQQQALVQHTIVPHPTHSTKPKWEEHTEEPEPLPLQAGPKVQVCDWVPEHQEMTPVASTAKSTYKPNQIQLNKAWPPPIDDDTQRGLSPGQIKMSSQNDVAWIQQESVTEKRVMRGAPWVRYAQKAQNEPVKIVDQSERQWPPPEPETHPSSQTGPQHMPPVNWPPPEDQTAQYWPAANAAELLAEFDGRNGQKSASPRPQLSPGNHDAALSRFSCSAIKVQKSQRQWPPPPPEYLDDSAQASPQPPQQQQPAPSSHQVPQAQSQQFQAQQAQHSPHGPQHVQQPSQHAGAQQQQQFQNRNAPAPGQTQQLQQGFAPVQPQPSQNVSRQQQPIAHPVPTTQPIGRGAPAQQPQQPQQPIQQPVQQPVQQPLRNQQPFQQQQQVTSICKLVW